jgi:CRISP-associated protein Cas1
MSILYVNTQGAKLRHSGGRFIAMRGDEELLSQPEASVDSVVLMGYVQISTQAVHALLDAGIPVIYLSRAGRFKGMLQPGYPKNVQLRLAQYDASLDASFAVDMAREIVRAKLDASQKTLSRWRQRQWLEDAEPGRAIAQRSRELDASETVESVRAIEAMSAKLYFDALGQTLPPPFEWNGRNRQPPLDPVNALLSLTYMMLTGECVGACYPAGLDPFVGFLHQLDYGRPSLALDLLEPFRPALCDRFVMRLLQQEVFHPDDFCHSEENGCRLQADRFADYIRAYAEYMHEADGNRRGKSVGDMARRIADAIKARQSAQFGDLLGGWA